MSEPFNYALLLALANAAEIDEPAAGEARAVKPGADGAPASARSEAGSRFAAPYVEEIGGVRSLLFNDSAVQSEMLVDHPELLTTDYAQAMMGFLLFNEDPASIEMIGLGGGSLVKYCHHKLPGARMSVVEINPEVIALRDRFLIPPDDERLSVIRGDGADFVREHEGRPDVLLVDGFDHRGQPPRLCSASFYDYCHERLAAGGVMVVNLYDSDEKFGVIAARIRESFLDQVVIIPSTGGANKVVFACKGGHFPPSRRCLLDRARRLEPLHSFSMSALAQRIVKRLEERKSRREEV